MTHPYPINGKRGGDITWTRLQGQEIPDTSSTLSVFATCFIDDKLIVVREGERWQLPGGHIEDGESIEEALVRECREEAGCILEDYDYFGYLRVTSKEPAINRHTGGHYPFPHAYPAIYTCEITQPLEEITCDEIDEMKLITIDEVDILGRMTRVAYDAFISRAK